MFRTSVLFMLAVTTTLTSFADREQWNWSDLPQTTYNLPPLCGVAWAEYQNSGAINLPNTNWAHWEKKKDHNGHPTIDRHQESGIACNHLHTWKNDIQLISDLNANAARFSIDWSLIQPTQGSWDQEALDRYAEMVDEMLVNGITPMATLHHFVHPQWFEELGGFEKEENISYFVDFCTQVINQLGSKIKLWCTINEPGPFMFQGYINAAFPPGKFLDIQAAAEVMCNMLVAHVNVYKSAKQLSCGKDIEIGIVHQYLPFEPYSRWNPLEQVTTYFLDYFFNKVALRFLKTGSYSFYIPGLASYEKEIPGAQHCYDFIGLNYYSHVVTEINPLTLTSGPSCFQGEIMTDMQYPIYPEGLYFAIKRMAELGKPIYVTENGCPDARDDRRALFIQRYLYALSKARNEGYDVRGYFYWSLMDNFEWNNGYDKHFGLYKVDFETQERTLREGAKILQKIYGTSRSQVAAA